MTDLAGAPPVPGGSRSSADGGDDLLARCRFPGPEAGPVTLAVSGGPDSMALMVLASRAGLGGEVVHVDHGLRPGSAGEARLVARAAADFGWSFRAERVEVSPGPDLEARARLARYSVLPAGVLTGHTMDDQGETVLLNVLRGAALDGWAGMRTIHPEVPTERGAATGEGPPPDARPAARWIRRPLLGLRRAETAELCRRSGLALVVDPSNDDARFRRNRVRCEVIPLLNDVARRDVVPILARQARLAAEDVALLDRLSEAVDPTDIRALKEAPPPLARRAVRRWLRSAAGPEEAPELHPPSSSEVERVLRVAWGEGRACQLAGGWRVERRRGRLVLTDPPGVGKTAR